MPGMTLLPKSDEISPIKTIKTPAPAEIQAIQFNAFIILGLGYCITYLLLSNVCKKEIQVNQ